MKNRLIYLGCIVVFSLLFTAPAKSGCSVSCGIVEISCDSDDCKSKSKNNGKRKLKCDGETVANFECDA